MRRHPPAASATWRVPRALTAPRPVGVALAPVHRGPRGGVHDRVGAHRGDGAEHLLPVGRHRAGRGRRRSRRGRPSPNAADQLGPSWPPAPVIRTCTGSIHGPQPTRRPGPAPQRLPPATGCPAYHATVAASPSSKPTAGAHPSCPDDLAGSSEVAAVVAGPVGTIVLSDRRLARAAASTRSAICSMLASSPAAHVVGLAHLAALEHGVDGPAVVDHVEPLAPVGGRRVQGQRLVVEGQGGEERDDLLGELVGPVVVGAVGHGDGQAVGLVVGPHGVVGARLGRRCTASGGRGRLLGELFVASSARSPYTSQVETWWNRGMPACRRHASGGSGSRARWSGRTVRGRRRAGCCGSRPRN